MATGKEIRAARKTLGLTQKQLAEKLNISYVNISQLENGKRIPRPNTLKRIAEALEISPDMLYATAIMLDGAYVKKPEGLTTDRALSQTAILIGQAYDRATSPVQRTVEVALEPFMEKIEE